MGVDAVFARDFPVLQVILIIVDLNIIVMNLLVDLVYGILDPRIRVVRLPQSSPQYMVVSTKYEGQLIGSPLQYNSLLIHNS
jgi:hypothetical protein